MVQSQTSIDFKAQKEAARKAFRRSVSSIDQEILGHRRKARTNYLLDILEVACSRVVQGFDASFVVRKEDDEETGVGYAIYERWADSDYQKSGPSSHELNPKLKPTPVVELRISSSAVDLSISTIEQNRATRQTKTIVVARMDDNGPTVLDDVDLGSIFDNTFSPVERRFQPKGQVVEDENDPISNIVLKKCEVKSEKLEQTFLKPMDIVCIDDSLPDDLCVLSGDEVFVDDLFEGEPDKYDARFHNDDETDSVEEISFNSDIAMDDCSEKERERLLSQEMTTEQVRETLRNNFMIASREVAENRAQARHRTYMNYLFSVIKALGHAVARKTNDGRRFDVEIESQDRHASQDTISIEGNGVIVRERITQRESGRSGLALELRVRPTFMGVELIQRFPACLSDEDADIPRGCNLESFSGKNGKFYTRTLAEIIDESPAMLSGDQLNRIFTATFCTLHHCPVPVRKKKSALQELNKLVEGT